VLFVFVRVNTPDPPIPAVKLALGIPGRLIESVIRVTGLRLAELNVEPSLFKCPTYEVSKAVALLFVAPPKFGTVPHGITSVPV
jgi:hypothetical protein